MTQYIYATSGQAVGFVRGNYIHALNGTAVGQLRGSHVHRLSGQYVGELFDDQVVDQHVGNFGNIGNPGNPGIPAPQGTQAAVGIADVHIRTYSTSCSDLPIAVLVARRRYSGQPKFDYRRCADDCVCQPPKRHRHATKASDECAAFSATPFAYATELARSDVLRTLVIPSVVGVI